MFLRWWGLIISFSNTCWDIFSSVVVVKVLTCKLSRPAGDELNNIMTVQRTHASSSLSPALGGCKFVKMSLPEAL
jgi:hypothetical protein